MLVGVKATLNQKHDYGKPIKNWESYFKKIVAQALIKVNIINEDDNKDININISGEANTSNSYTINNRNITDTKYLTNVLNRVMNNTDSYNKYANYVKIFFLNASSRGENAYTQGNNCVIFDTHTEQTIPHEFLHALGLPHSFFFEANSIVYEAMNTFNIMDYSHLPESPVPVLPGRKVLRGEERFYTWFWQWERMRKNNLLSE